MQNGRERVAWQPQVAQMETKSKRPRASSRKKKVKNFAMTQREGVRLYAVCFVITPGASRLCTGRLQEGRTVQGEICLPIPWYSVLMGFLFVQGVS